MTGEAIMISSRSRFLSITVLLAMLGGVTLTDALAFVTELTATPAEPGCEDEVTLEVEGYVGTSCFLINDIEFHADGPWVGFFIYLEDTLGEQCAQVITEYSSSESIGPLPSGDYYVFALEFLAPSGGQGDYVSFPLTACCPGTEAPVTDLRLQKINDGQGVSFTWTDVPGATEYRLYQDGVPEGTFDVQVGTSTSGDPGIDLPVVHDSPAFFLLAQASSCGEGPKH